ncbi:MAG TPA: peptidylprolyl isomerase [Candidatus Angelobacter sp.]|jgi:parvulin-like peptidyl-prolyl isomerase|nr:peptidylprolyl isomerase [Candidatus Angelobacter sp.]
MIRTLVVLALAVAATAQSQNPTAAPKPRTASSGQASSGQASSGQSTGASSSAKKSPVAGAGQKAADSTEAVITIQGLCSAPARQAASAAAATPSCTTVITKAQFEDLLNTINPTHQPIPQAQRQQLAQRYVDLLIFADAARKAGTENKPQFQQALRIQRLAILQQIFLQDLEEKYKTPDQQEVETYYKDNLSKFDEVKLHRILIPKANPSGQANKEEYEKKAPQVANDIRERAAKGEDVDKLQKDAYEALGITNPPPSTDLGKRKRGMFPPQEDQDIFALKSGEVTKVEPGNSGFVIYKVDVRETIPLEQVKDEISRNLSQQKLKSKVDSIKASVHPDFNKEYFVPPAAPDPPTPPGGAHPVPPPSSLPQAPTPKPVAPSTPPQPTAPPSSTPTTPPPSPSAPPK